MLRRWFLGLTPLVLLSPPGGAAAKRRDVEIVDLETDRPAGTVEFSGIVVVHRQKPIQGLLLVFEFFDPGDVLLTQQKLLIEEGAVQAGDEIPFDLVGDDVPRAVSIRIRVQNRDTMELSVENEGPHPI